MGYPNFSFISPTPIFLHVLAFLGECLKGIMKKTGKNTFFPEFSLPYWRQTIKIYKLI